MPKNKTGKTKPSDKIIVIPASLLAQVTAAKTIDELKAVIIAMLKRMGM